MNIVQRAKAPTPKFFKKLRNIGIALAAISAAIVTAPVSFPAGIITAAGYLGVAGAVATTVSQLTTAEEPKGSKKKKEADDG